MPEQTNQDENLVNRLQSEGPSPHAGDDVEVDPEAGGPAKPDEDLISRLEAEGPSPHAGDDAP